MRFLKFKKVLCLSPHPDDVEYSMLGSVLKYSDTYFDTLCFTKGGDFDKTTGDQRWLENKKIWDKLPNGDITFSDVCFLKEKGEDGWINFIETNFINKNSYDCIFIPTKADSHFEHQTVNNLAPALTRDKKISIIEYRTPSTLDDWSPNMFVEIEKDLYKQKIKYLTYFKTQKERWYFKNEVLSSFHANYPCHKRGMRKVECFKISQLCE